MRDNNTQDKVGGDGARRRVNRRSVLRAAGAAGVTGALAGCLGTVEREYEATPVSVPEETAREHGFESEPRVERQTASFSRSVGVADVAIDVTGYIYRYEHRGESVTEVETTSPEGVTKETPTSGSEPTPTPDSPSPTSADTPTPTQTPIDTTPSDDDEERTAIDTTPQDRGTPTGGDGTGEIQEVEPDRLNVTTTPNPSFVGVDLNPAAGKSVEDLIETETAAFEQACGCDIKNPAEVEVRLTATPTETQVTAEDVGRTVFSIDPASRSLDVPETVELMGEDRPLGYFAFATPTENGDGVAANLVVTAKGTGQAGSGTNEAVVASYFSKAGGIIPPPGVSEDDADPEQELSITAQEGTGADQPASLFTPSQLQTAARRFTPVCPEMTPTGGGSPGTGTATPGGTDRSAPERNPCAQYQQLLARRRRLVERQRAAFDSEIAAKNELESLLRSYHLLQFQRDVESGEGERLKAKRRLVESDLWQSRRPDLSLAEHEEQLAARAETYRATVAERETASEELARVETTLEELLVESGGRDCLPPELPPVGLDGGPPPEGIPTPTRTPVPTSSNTEVAPTATESPTTETETPDPNCHTRCTCSAGWIAINVDVSSSSAPCITGANGHAWITVGKIWACNRYCDGERVYDSYHTREEANSFGLEPGSAAGQFIQGGQGDLTHMKGREQGGTREVTYSRPIECEKVGQILGELLRKSDDDVQQPEYSIIPREFGGTGGNCSSWAVETFNRLIEENTDSKHISEDDKLTVGQANPCDNPKLRPNTLAHHLRDHK